MCTEIDKHCEIGQKRLLMSSIETENQLSYCGSTIVLLGPLFWYREIQGFHTFLGLHCLDPHQGSALDLSGAYNVPRPPAMLSNNLWSLHILSKRRLSIPHHLGGGQNFKCILQGGRKFFDTTSAGKLHPPTHRKNDSSLRGHKITPGCIFKLMCNSLSVSNFSMYVIR